MCGGVFTGMVTFVSADSLIQAGSKMMSPCSNHPTSRLAPIGTLGKVRYVKVPR